ncbi:ComF family protein [Noviherbaspirillum sedimenti]|uniref:ComF family protein n=1 Tax=Noviherbaspirillum sedimenti TaxID=2320865 RepID=A0A3A3G6U9_9BURK|nr:ComF family protein [Noviherbaspirillum sedimenti]RJG03554.1 ComF family protein [Noviherbaspirillum sedimenti]
MLAESRLWLQRCLRHLPQLLPSSCALCGASDRQALCAGCHGHYFSKALARCRQCAAPLPAAVAADMPGASDADGAPGRCGDCLAQPPAFDITVTASDYLPPVDQLVMALKFGGRLALAPLFAQLQRDALLRSQALTTPLPDWLTAVPLGPRRLRERGFNQALEVARPLAHHLGLPLYPQLLQRLRDTRAQSQLHQDERQGNLREAFTVSQEFIDTVRGRHVGVVDDVLTTGATLNEVAATLKRFGAARVTNLIFARTPPRQAKQ